MQHRKTLSRLTVTSLALASIAVPTASAMPIQPIPPITDMHASTVHKPKPVTPQHLQTEATADTPSGVQARHALPGPPTWPIHPQPISHAPAPVADNGGDGSGIDLSESLAIAGALVLAGTGAAALRFRTRTRPAH
jgi:hypothetical protein